MKKFMMVMAMILTTFASTELATEGTQVDAIVDLYIVHPSGRTEWYEQTVTLMDGNKIRCRSGKLTEYHDYWSMNDSEIVYEYTKY